MAYNKKIKYTELVLIILVWFVLLFTPILFREDIYSPVKRSVINQIEILIPLLFVFLINRFLLVPFLLYRGKQTKFVISAIFMIVLCTAGLFVYDKRIKDMPPDLPLLQQQVTTPPYAYPGGVDVFSNLRPAQQRQPRPIPPFANFLILSVLIVGFDTGLRLSLRGIDIESEKVRLEKENVATQLVLLRNQVSPHFLMNTLNNIHSLVDVNHEEAKEAIIKLSKMMRYLLYETETEKTTLAKEIEFLESYINLMKLRFNERVIINLKMPAIIPDKTIPPFIFTSLIENAFKHGISYKDESFIAIEIIIKGNNMLLSVRNSKTEKTQTDKYSGIGIENTRKRLELLYGSNYSLDILDANEVFAVNLSIPL